MIDATSSIDNARFLASGKKATELIARKNADGRFSDHLDSALSRFATRGGGGSGDEKLKSASVEMESLFVANMLKEMRKTLHKTGWLDGGQGEKIFEDMLYDEYALQISRNSNLGLAKQIYNEMSGKNRSSI